MKSSIIKSFRLKLACLALLSMLLTIGTDCLLVGTLYVIRYQIKNTIEYQLIDTTPDNKVVIIEIEEDVEGENAQANNNKENVVGNSALATDNKKEKPMAEMQLHTRAVITNNVIIDAVIIVLFSILIFMVYYVLLSYKVIDYFREIHKGIQRITSGDLNTNIRVRGDDELSQFAYSVNSMRIELKGLMERERKAEQVKNELITNVAHDLRTPLTSIIGYLDLLDSESQLEEEKRKKYVHIAYQKARRLERLIQELFDFTRYEKDKLKLNLVKLDMTRFMEQLVEEFYPSMQENRLECYTVFPRESLYINGDGESLARAFGNLMSNAIKYGAEGKQLRLELHGLYGNQQIRVAIINYGRMIPEKDLGKIFEKFYRVESSRATHTGGTGLGLAIAKNIIEMHQGVISVSSDEDGTVFEVIFPGVKQNKEDIHEEKH